VRESPSVFLMEKLRDLGGRMAYSDPHVPTFPRMREHHFDMSSTPLTPENIAKFDCVLLATDHDKFDYEMVRTRSALLIDCRGKFLAHADNIVRA
jgi:UDP-N-acetyl-D-glucosamine dehydrogenase